MTGPLHKRFRQNLMAFRDDCRGITAILFALMAVPLLGLSLAALDYTRAQGTKTAIQNAADTAATAGAAMLGATHGEIEESIRGYLRTNLPKDHPNLPFVLIFAPQDAALTIKMNTSVPTSILGIVGKNEFEIAVESTVARPDPIKELQAPHPGIAPELPPELEKELAKFPGLDRSVSAAEMQHAEEQARQIIRDLEQSGGGAEVEQLLRGLSQLN